MTEIDLPPETAADLSSLPRWDALRVLLSGERGPLQAMPNSLFSEEQIAVPCYIAALSLPALGKGHLSRMKGYEARQRYQERVRLAVECSSGPEEWGDALARACGVTRSDLNTVTRLRWLSWCQGYASTSDLLSLDWLDLMSAPSIDSILTAADIARGWLFDLSRAAKAAKDPA